MSAKYTDQEIDSLLREPKPLSKEYRMQVRLKDKRGHKEQELDIAGGNGAIKRMLGDCGFVLPQEDQIPLL